MISMRLKRNRALVKAEKALKTMEITDPDERHEFLQAEVFNTNPGPTQDGDDEDETYVDK
jgi:hypothetical protein